MGINKEPEPCDLRVLWLVQGFPVVAELVELLGHAFGLHTNTQHDFEQKAVAKHLMGTRVRISQRWIGCRIDKLLLHMIVATLTWDPTALQAICQNIPQTIDVCAVPTILPSIGVGNR